MKRPPVIAVVRHEQKTMNIFIDESGSFAFAQHTTNAIACVGALTVPETCHAEIVTSFTELERSWGIDTGEIKGRDLSETQIAQVVNLLIPTGAKFHVCLTDMSLNTPPGVAQHKQDQVRRITKHLTPQHQPSLVAQYEEAAKRLDCLSDQLYVQLCMITHLIARQLRDTSVFYAFTGPSELGSYHWVLHAKNQKPTAYEKLWECLVSGFLQSEGLNRDVFMTVDGGDYSHFERFCKILDKWPDHLPPRRSKESQGKPVEVIDISTIMHESVTITGAKSVAGLRLADICTNAFRRALVGNLQFAGWCDLGKLMLWCDRSKNPFVMVRIDIDDDNVTSDVNTNLSLTLAQIGSQAAFAYQPNESPFADHVRANDRATVDAVGQTLTP